MSKSARTNTSRHSAAKATAAGLIALLSLPLGGIASAAAPANPWSAPAAVFDDTTQNATAAIIAVSTNGDAVAAWPESIGANTVIFAAVYTPASGWGSPARIQTYGNRAEPASFAMDAAMDAQGDAIVVWLDYTPGYDTVWASRYLAGWGWGGPVRLDTGTESAALPRLSMDAAGDAVAVWQSNDGARHNIWGNRYAVATGWGGAAALESTAADCGMPDVTVFANGTAMAAWVQDMGFAFYQVQVSSSPASGGWTAGASPDIGGLSVSYWPRIGGDGQGNALVVWVSFDGVNYIEEANRYRAAAGWAGANAVGPMGSTLLDPADLSVSGNGDAVAVWGYLNGTSGFEEASASTFKVGSGWAGAARINSSPGHARAMQAVIDGRGVAIAVWTQDEYTSDSAWFNRYVPGQGWGADAALDREVFAEARGVGVALGGDGDAWAAWLQGSSSGHASVWASHYSEPDTAPPALTVTAPSNGASFSVPTVRVTGTTEPSAVVSVGGYGAAVLSDGSFALSVPLAAGTNLIRITATDAAGNTAVATVNITYADPTPGLQAQLASAQANATALQASVSATQAALAAAQAQLAQAVSDAAAARASANATAGDLATTQASLTDTRAQLVVAQGRLNSTTSTGNTAITGSGDTTLPLLIALGAMAIGAGGLIVGMRAGSAVSRSNNAARKPDAERKPPT